MARIKCRPRVAQLSPEPEPAQPEVAQVTSNNNLPDKSTDSAPTIPESSNDIEDQAASDLLTISQSTQAVVVESLEPEESVLNDLPLLAGTNLTCPQCRSMFPNMSIQDFREHVESCTRPTTAFSDTSNDSLSPPPQSLLGDDELDYLPPYHLTAFNSYPGSKPDGTSEETGDVGDGQQKVNYPQITDVAKFAESFEGMEEMDYATLYNRTANAQNALVHWQNEWMELDGFIRVREPAAAAKEQKNPRVPKAAMIGIGYQDQLESFVYGYEHNTHFKAVGMQDPLSQRLTNGSNGGRELRQRVPTQKAAEAEMSTTPDSDDEIGGRRRMRGRKVREGTAGMEAGGSRISRMRNESRLNSESRDPTPPKTFASGRAVGRPRKNKTAGSTRLQELRPDLDPYSIIAQDDEDQSGRRENRYGPSQTLATTESWATIMDPVGTDSRPTTSDSATTGISTDDTRNPPLRASTRTRKRQNTSDFEDALPYSKRIGRPVRKAKPADSGGLGQEHGKETGGPFANGEPSSDMILSSDRPIAQKQDSLANDEGVGRKIKRDKGKGKTNNGNGLNMSGGGKPSASTKAASKKAAASTQEVVPQKDGPKISRASENMRRRWAAKKKAEALGLPVPKIGRYPKGESVTSAQDVVEQSNSPKPTVGRKRKRDDDEPSNASVGAADGVMAAVESSVPAKKRGGRQKKAVQADPETNPASNFEKPDGESAEINAVPVRNNTGLGEPSVPVAPKKKGGNPKKNAAEFNSSTLNGPEAAAEDQRDMAGQKLLATPELETSNGGENAITSSVSPELDQPRVGEINVAAEDHVQAPQPRTSGRIRRQTSAALSSQADTQRSNRSSQKPTVTPTPAPTQQSMDEPKIKEEQPTAGPIVTRKRGRQPNSANPEMASKTPSVPRDIVDDQEPPPKRRRAERRPRGASPDSAPPLIISSEEAESAHEQPVVKKRGGRPQKVVIEDTLGTETTSEGRITPKESSVVNKRGQSKDAKTGIPSAPVVFPGVVIDGNVAVRARIIRFKKIVRPDATAPIATPQVDSTAVQAKGVKSSKKKADSSEPRAKGKSLRAATIGHHDTDKVLGAEEEAANAQSPMSESPEEEVLDEAAIEKAKVEAAKLSKSAKMSAAMKARWENGSMKAVMAKKKAANEARRAQKALAGQSSEVYTPVAPASAPTKRKAAGLLEEPVRATKRRQNMAATMDGAADTDSDSDVSLAMPRRAATTGRKTSESERFHELASPSIAPSRRQRRPAALRASQSISMFRDINGDEEHDHTEVSSSSEDEDEETEIKKQFDSEYDHFQAALSSPLEAPGILTGKRKRKPVMNLEEAMRIEASEDDADFEDI